jgi:hypothetical protein
VSNYAQEAIDAINAELPGLEPELASLYALLSLVTGKGTMLEDVHDAWAVYRAKTRPDHQALIPFDELTPEVQELDRKYMDGIHRVSGNSDPRYEAMKAIPDGGWAYIIDRWYVRCPGSPFAADLSKHEVVDHGDGTITVSPSILYEVPGFEPPYSYHGFLERGVWRSV